MKAEALIGTALGTCTLQKIIGQGGMAAVFLAQQSRPRRQVAVKVLLPATALTPHQRAAFLERFRRETDAAASLEHPHILPVHEYGERDGFAYLVVPYISGGTLRDALEQECPLPLQKALNYVEQLAAALDFAHERGVIHRDIKPANILITTEGRLLLTDFGLVKIIADGQTPQTRLTGAGAPVGTPDYMSPEQVIGDAVDGRSDLYSLGIILYQMVTGLTPFQGETPMQIAAQQLQAAVPSPRLLRPDLPLAAEQVILKILSKRPTDRYASGQDFAGAFRNALAFSGALLSSTGGMPAVASSTSGRLFTPRGLFDPDWQTGTMSTTGGNISQAKPTGVLPAANAEAARPTGLLSRTGRFPHVVGTGALPAIAEVAEQGSVTTGALPTMARSQQAGLKSTEGQHVPQRTGMLPTLKGTGAQPELASPELLPKPTGSPCPQTAGALPAVKTTGGQPAIQPLRLKQLSPVRNTTGALPIPGDEQSTGKTMKLTGPMKVVQMPVAGQPGRYITGLLPVSQQAQQPKDETDTTKVALKKPQQKIVLAVLALLVIFASGISFWYLHTRAGQGKNTNVTITQSATGTPNVKATAAAQASATAGANQILSDSLSQNIHNFPTGPNEFFKGGAYHIFNTEGNAVAVVLPEQPFNAPNAYQLTMWEVRGDDTSNNNSFGMIIRFSQLVKAGKNITTFYSFEVVNVAGGEYRFYKYDDSQGSPAKDWTQLWHQPFGKEFHQGQGPKNMNTIRIYQNGSSFSFTVNGKLIGSVHDSSFKSGTLGMLVNLKGTEVAFMNMLITHK